MDPLLDIHDVTVFRGRTRVLDGFSLRIDEGCSTAILGPNGAGKSTLLKLVSGDIHPVHSPGSHIRVLGREHWNVWDLRSHLGVVSHDVQSDYQPGTLGMDVVLSGFYSSVGLWDHQVFTEAEKSKAEEIMAVLGVAGLKRRRFDSLSTGEQRRLLLGRALIHDPRALLFDEPTSGLDLKTSFIYRELLSGLIRRGATIVLVTHHIHEIPEEVQRVVLLKGGAVVADGPRDAVLTSQALSALFEYPLEAVSLNGAYQVFPAAG